MMQRFIPKRIPVFYSILILAIVITAGCRKAETPVQGNETSATATKETKGAAEPAAAAGSDVGSTMPEYSAAWLDGKTFDLAARRDKVILLNVWATWCGPCRYEIPELQNIHEKYGPRGFEVIGVSVDETGAEAVREFVAEYKVSYPIALDAEGKIASLFQTSVLPTSVLIDRKGTIVWKQYGAIVENDPALAKAIEAAL